MVTATGPAQTSRSPVSFVQAGLALLAACVWGLRAVRTASGQASPDGDVQLVELAWASAAALAAVAAAVLVLAGRRRPAALALAFALGVELADRVEAAPRLVTAPLLAVALVLSVVTGTRGPQRPLHGAANVVALILMLPVGLLYLLSGLIVPTPDLYGMYALYAVLLTAAAVLARRGSWWVLAAPPLSAALWFLLVTLGGEHWGWQP